jgi:hypothetical protein
MFLTLSTGDHIAVLRFLVAVTTLFTSALIGATPAFAHVDVAPRLLEAGEETTLRVELPRLRPGAPPTDVAVAGAGVRQLSAEAAGLIGVESRWRVRVRVDAEPGPLTLLLRAEFADGETVVVRHPVTVVPARSGGGRSAATLVAGAAAVIVAVGSAVLLVRRGRRAH